MTAIQRRMVRTMRHHRCVIKSLIYSEFKNKETENSGASNMKQRTEWKIAAIMIIGLVIFEGFAWAAEVNEPDKSYKGEVQFRYDWLGVNRDRGRFREDNWMTDGSTGGLDWLHIESTRPDKNGYEWLLEGRALHDYDYEMSLLMKKPDSHYLKLDFSGLRRYYDGSNEFPIWDEGLMSTRFREWPDYGLYVDRRNYNIELGLTPPEGWQTVFGWHRLEKDGKEVLLHGARRASAPFGDAGFHRADIADLRGITDTIYGEFSNTFAEKYNLRIRQEFEQYHAEQKAFALARFNDDGSFPATYERWGKDDLGYTNWRTMVMFDSFLDKQTYVTADYMFNYLNSNSTHKFYRTAIYLAESDVDNSKTTNVYGLGYRRANILEVQNLDLSVGVRIEDSKTDSQSDYVRSTLYTLKSNLDETRVAEVLRLVYKGFKRTTLSFDAQLEERQLNWDARRNPSYADFDRETDTDFLDQIYTLKAVHRCSNDIKSTIAYKYKNLERSLTNLYRVSADYPGWLGNYRTTGSDLLVKTDFRLNSETSATLLYQYVQENIDFELGGRTSDQEIHRGSGSISSNLAQNLFLVGTFMLENRRLDTPAVGDPCGSGPGIGTRLYDFRGNSYSLMLDGTYAFNEKTSSTLGFRHTEALGTVGDAGNYIFDKVSLTLKHKFAANQTVGLGYQFYYFNNHTGGSSHWDDYTAHGAFVTYGYTF